MRRHRSNHIAFPCDLCRAGEHSGPCRTLVNAGATAMFWGSSNAMGDVLASADESDGPGLIEEHPDGVFVVYLWLTDGHECALAERHWWGCKREGDEWQRRWRATRADFLSGP